MKEIKDFCIGTSDATAIFTKSKDKFFKYIEECLEEAEENEWNTFDIEIIPPETEGGRK